MAKVKDVLAALDDLTGGRCLKGPGDWAGGKNPWVVTNIFSPSVIMTQTVPNT